MTQLSVCLGLVLVISVFGTACLVSLPRAAAYTVHEPILILSDSDFTSANGVTSGRGTQSDPFMIDGWEIDASAGNGIDISGTTAWFVIQNVFVHSSPSYGILISNAQNARITSSTLSENEYSIGVIGTPGCVIDGNEVSATYGGIIAAFADGFVIEGNHATITDEGYPIGIGVSNYSVIEENIVTGDRGNGIFITQTNESIIRANQVGPSGVTVENSYNCSLWDNGLQLSGIGVSGSRDQLGTLDIPANNTANGRPIYYLKNLVGGSFGGVDVGQVIVVNCSNMTVSDFEIVNVTNCWEPWYTAALECLWSEDLIISNLTMSANARGILLDNCPRTIVAFCNVSGNYGTAIEVDDSPSSSVTGCTLYDNWAPMSLHQSPGSIVCGNVASRNNESMSVNECNDTLVTGNYVGWSETSAVTVSSSNNVTISYCSLEYGGMTNWYGAGIYIRSVTNGEISNNTIKGFDRGIEMGYCSEIEVLGNELRENRECGIMLSESSGCTFDHNWFIGNVGAGLDLMDWSDNTTITWNVFEGNNWGIYFSALWNTTVHHNDFAGNSRNAYTHVPLVGNTWDDGYPSGGNYWSDYVGTDDFSGPEQNISGSDGMGDTPYCVTASYPPYYDGYFDRYPFMDPLQVTRNERPAALCTVNTLEGNISTEFVFNASMSYDAEDSVGDLQVRWDFGYNGSWDTEWSTDKNASWRFSSPGDYLVHMQIRDSRMYLNDTVLQIHVVDEAPIASFVASSEIGDVTTNLQFDASGSRDLETNSSAMEVRWDWDNDGVWDTGWTTVKTASHLYSTPGTYTVALEVRDSQGQTANSTLTVTISAAVPEFGSALVPALFVIAAAILFSTIRRSRRS